MNANPTAPRAFRRPSLAGAAWLVIWLAVTGVACSGPNGPRVTEPVRTATAPASATPRPADSSTPTARPSATSTPPTATATNVALDRPESQTVDLPDVDAHYILDVTTFETSTGQLRASERVEVSSQQGPMSSLAFVVTPAVYGYFTLEECRVDGAVVEPEVRNGGFTLSVPLPAGEAWVVEFDFRLELDQVPEDWYGTGIDGDIVRLGYWFPIISADYPYPSTADPPYTRVADFDVFIPVSADYLIAHTGSEAGREVLADGRTRLHIRAERVRDFAIVVAPGFQVDSVTSASGVRIDLYSRTSTDDAVRRIALDAAARTIDRLSDLIGPYPYPVFRMVDAGPSLPGGIEFPMLIYLNLSLRPDTLDRLVYHEAAHQWFYAIIGTRPQQDPWIDEGGAQFLEGGIATGFDPAAAPTLGGYDFPLDAGDAELPAGDGIPGYRSVYVQGYAFYQRVHDMMGEDAFWLAMQDLYQRFRFDIVTPWDLLLIWQHHSPVDLRPLFADVFRYDWIELLPPPGA